ncbi:nucleotide exchange factor GrpE [Tuwongella immobilis]|uniref:Uncharacterized protein n=1 Tax=Tuwongella immobilis TaxID=692036 RepID=A0A6C2YXK1_9BACT|nr:hypothetical protein [Tuwongella immobilis]VIP05599.1 Uncharacterized protein OS=Singulisphaera acidiphila (strain ATCC BAA-1392 / DSM 18658 / VKM B-2454 / MOB10) GN=Sinac_1659 PE=4 SV=1 [Tuwongella immobilis]VTS08553.1 Uncharacterized protein OS=Singulisphaera acidiphila (strain ATCC BAA-1392 / DSM 18658 / VKM B-2454 / MOB10) GN=Sinac_1659 PE=4 SV=1 [Tuwongella immobilis]
MSTTDPTLEFLRRFNDPNLWVVERAVPIFKPHKRSKKLPNGQVASIEVTAGDIPEIAQQMVQLERSGTPARITEGHLKPDLPESMQPDLLGFCRSPRVGRFGPQQELAVVADLYYLRDKAERAKRYPYRSVEYYPPTKEIRGVALLMRDPQLDMGIVHYQLEVNSMTNTPAPAPTPTPEGDEALSPAEEKLAQKYWKHYMKQYAWMGKAAAHYEGGGGGASAMPSATNGGMPALSDSSPPPATEAERMQRDQMAVQFQRMQAEMTALRTQAEREKCERLVMQLEAEGYNLQRAVEVQRLLPLTAAERTNHLDYVRQCYSRQPVASPIRVYSGHVETPTSTDNPTESQMEAAVQYMRDHSCDWDVAISKIMKKG